jgi:translocation and assembly module TamA
LSLAGFGLAAAHVHAFEVFGIKLFEDQSELDAESVIADPQPYTVAVNTNNAPDEVTNAVNVASSLVADASLPASGAAGLLAKAKGDYRRILAALYGEGYYGGAISILIDGREAATLPPDIELPDPVAVSINVTSGPLFRFGKIEVVNRAARGTDPGDYVEPPEQIGLMTGEVAKSTIVAKAEQLIVDAWRQQGYAKAAVAGREVVADHDTNTVDVTITVVPGGLARVGNVGVDGTTAMDPNFVAQQTGLIPGAEYDPDDIERAEKRLARLEVFRAMRVEAAEDIGPDGILPFTVVVEELPGRRFGVGATYSTVDGLGLEGFHLWRNLFGHAERLRLDAKIAGIGFPVNTADFDYAFGGTFTLPGFLTPDTDLVTAISAERTVLPTYTETSATGRAGVTHYLFDDMTLSASGYYERSRFDDGFGTRDFSIAGLTGGFTFDNRDEPTNATEGFFVDITAEPFYEFFYGNPGFRATAEARTYFSFSEDDMFVLAARVKAGALIGPGLDEIPPDRLFFAGGGGSVRGYGFKSIGVVGPGGIVTGGRYLLEGSLEARVKIASDIGLVAFLDGGYVAADTFPGIDKLMLGAGVGLRYYTGLGPLRLDVAFPLNKRPGDPDYALYVGIGQTF